MVSFVFATACLGLRSSPLGPESSRRAVLSAAARALAFAAVPRLPALAADGLLDDLPPKAVTAYKQYWPALQLAADEYVFDVYALLDDPGKWDSIGMLTETTDIGSASSVSRLERDFITPMRILSLAFPPDAGGDEMQGALNRFQTAGARLSAQARAGQTTGNLAQPSAAEIAGVLKCWDEGRLALNAFFLAVNTGTAIDRLVVIPANGKGYPRSKSLYVQLRKDSALCRNRGGEALAGLWGQLMVYGTVPGVNPCGNVNLGNYFTQ